MVIIFRVLVDYIFMPLGLWSMAALVGLWWTANGELEAKRALLGSLGVLVFFAAFVFDAGYKKCYKRGQKTTSILCICPHSLLLSVLLCMACCATHSHLLPWVWIMGMRQRKPNKAMVHRHSKLWLDSLSAASRLLVCRTLRR